MSIELYLSTINKGSFITGLDPETVTSFTDLSSIPHPKRPPLSSYLDRNDLEPIVGDKIPSPPTSPTRKEQEGYEIPETPSPPTSHTRKEQEGYEIPETPSPPTSNTRKEQEGYEIPETPSPPTSHTRKEQEGYEIPETPSPPTSHTRKEQEGYEIPEIPSPPTSLNTKDQEGCGIPQKADDYFESVFELDDVDTIFINFDMDDNDSDDWSVRSSHSNHKYLQERAKSENSLRQNDNKNKEHTKSTKSSNERKNEKAQKSMWDTGVYTQMEVDEDKLTGKWNQFVKKYYILILILSFINIGICIVIYVESNGDQQNFEDDKIRVPCEALRDFYPVASLYMFDDDITNQRFEAAGIRKVKDTGNSISCEVNFTSIMLRMSRDEYNVVEGQVRLQADKKGPTLEYSNYNLSVTQADLRGVSHDPQALIIQMEGDYFVYFGIELVYGPQNSCRKLHYQTSIIHLLIQENSTQYPRALMASEHTCCVTCDTETSTEFTGGLFHFKDNDRLFIQVSSPQNIGTSGVNNPGMFRIIIITVDNNMAQQS